MTSKTARRCNPSLKLFLVSIISLIFCPRIDAQAIRGLEGAGLLRTEHFEIYYSLSMAGQAMRLSGFADTTLKDIEAVFGSFAPKTRIPVLVTDIQPELNGYAIPYPSNRMVLYLAEPDLRDALATFDDELKMVFTHELVHLVNMNERAPFWKFAAAVLGDVVSPAAWTMPYALLEGTAVWMESGLDKGIGRLNDPAALEIVRLDIARGLRRSVWDVSGVLEYPGSGSLPYMYGGLFVEYIAERFGPGALAEMWRMSGEGNLFDGFTAPSGIAEQVTQVRFRELWDSFLDWVSPRLGISPADSVIAAAPNDSLLLSGRFGPVAADDNAVYYLDLEKKAVFALDLALPAGEENHERRPRRLFEADGYLAGISLADDGRTLDLEWIRTDAAGTRKAWRYLYYLDGQTLRTAGKEAPADGNGRQYSLLGLGSSVVPSRVSPAGSREYVEFPEGSLRSLQADSPDHMALSFTPPGSPSRIAVLRQAGEKWELLVQTNPPPGGAHTPAFAGPDRLAYVTWLSEGRQELRLLDFGKALASGQFSARDIAWLPAPARETPPAVTDGFSSRPFTVLFPKVLSSVRYPYLGKESAGIIAQGSDLSERLSWEARAGWEFDSGIPEARLEIALAASGHSVRFEMSDSSVPSSGGYARVSGASLGWNYVRTLLPVRRSAGLRVFASASGVDDAYSFAQWLKPAWDHSSLGTGISLHYSDMTYDPFAPFDTRGAYFGLTGDFEMLPGIIQAASITGSVSLASARPGLKLSLYGAYSPPGGVLFLPSGRHFRVSGISRGSALPVRYPYFDEYSAISAGSPWYGFAELSARLLAVETGRTMKPVEVPFLPSWTLRRFSIVAGLRAAAMEMSSTAVLPASGFLRLETDFALLAGFASQAHAGANIEAAYAFDQVLAAGSPLFISFGYGMWY